MRAGLFLFCAPLALGLSLVLGACDDPTGGIGGAEIVEDSVLIAVPDAPSPANAALPSALDVTPVGLVEIVGGRFPERQDHAEAWDLTLRVRNGELVLLAPAAIGLTSEPLRRAGITEAIAGRTFETLTRAPESSQYVTNRPVALKRGAVYGVRSRVTGGGFGGSCSFFAKLQPLELNVAAGTARLRVATSALCSDPRLSRED
ncbi:MAG: hypothetical protein M3P24_06300 [Gemmatimonadota bacterium]|nr:hypothetical protein [Gemmatimonadota bacterium]